MRPTETSPTNTPTGTLSSEHRVIERALDVLLALARAPELDRAGAQDVVDFLRGYADRYHHDKEEEQLFPRLERKGMPRDVGPVAVMLHEHELGRAAVAEMAGALETRDDAAFTAAAEGYVALLRDHIAKEDGVLFPMADSMLEASETESLLAAYDSVESEHGGQAARLRARMEQLALELELPPTVRSSGSGACGLGGGGCHDAEA